MKKFINNLISINIKFLIIFKSIFGFQVSKYTNGIIIK